MKYRKKSKIKRQHSMIEGLEKCLEKLEQHAEIKAIIPGPIRMSNSNYQGFILRPQRKTQTGLKCAVRNGKRVQEVYLTGNGEKIKALLKD